jgi:HD-like signal output (HDOD) protein
MSVERGLILKAAASLGVIGGGPRSAPRILAALCNPTVDVGDVAGVIGREPALYARVLKIANSPYYGQSRRIMTLDRAVVVLGLDAVRGIAAAACLDRTFPRGKQTPLVDLNAVVQHSLATAAAAESLAKLGRPALAPDAFIAGLLHNLGIIVQMALDAPGIEAMIRLRAGDDRREMRALELERSQIGHEECISVIFEEWQLPEALIAAVHNHHDPIAVAPAHRDLAALINLGASMGLAAGSTFNLEPAPGSRNSDAMTWLGVDDGQLDAIAVGLPDKVRHLAHALLTA